MALFRQNYSELTGQAFIWSSRTAEHSVLKIVAIWNSFLLLYWDKGARIFAHITAYNRFFLSGIVSVLEGQRRLRGCHHVLSDEKMSYDRCKFKNNPLYFLTLLARQACLCLWVVVQSFKTRYFVQQPHRSLFSVYQRWRLSVAEL